jgi:hypothetical protein
MCDSALGRFLIVLLAAMGVQNAVLYAVGLPIPSSAAPQSQKVEQTKPKPVPSPTPKKGRATRKSAPATQNPPTQKEEAKCALVVYDDYQRLLTGCRQKSTPNTACDLSKIQAHIVGKNSGPKSYGRPVIKTDLQGLDENRVEVQYLCDEKFSPSILELGLTGNPELFRTALTANTADSSVEPRIYTVAGDYSGFQGAYPLQGLSGTVWNSDQSLSATLSRASISNPSFATLSFESTADFKPAVYQLCLTTSQPHCEVFNFALAAPPVDRTVNFGSPDVGSLCNNSTCSDADLHGLSLTASPASSDAVLTPLAITSDYVVAQVRAPIGYVPDFVVAQKGNAQVVARRLTSPPVNGKAVNISFALMDQASAISTFGHRIGERYLVVQLEIHNPTSKKLQLNKSAVWFDVDYVEAYPKKGSPFWKKALGFGWSPPKSLIPPEARVFRYGIDQTTRHSPHSFQEILGVFDATTNYKNRTASYYDLQGSLLGSIASSIGDNSALNIAAHLVTGTLLPGIKQLMLDPEGENRKRSNLVNQGLQNFIQVGPGTAASTLVFLPQETILAFVDRGEVTGAAPNKYPQVKRPPLTDKLPIVKDATYKLVPVAIKKVLEVHWDPEVISAVTTEETVPGFVRVGMSKDEVRRAMGEPDTVTTNPDKTSCFLYSAGEYSKVCFDTAALVSTITSRTKLEQVTAAKTYEKIRTILLGDAHVAPTERRDLVDGGFVWFDAPILKTNLRFDSHSNLQDPDYKEAYSKIAAMKDKTKADFDKTIKGMGLTESNQKDIEVATKTAASNISRKIPSTRYPSPDLKDEYLEIKFAAPVDKNGKTDANAAKNPDQWTVVEITRTLRK